MKGIVMTGESPNKAADGTKTMTRRIIKPQPEPFGDRLPMPADEFVALCNDAIARGYTDANYVHKAFMPKPRYQPGERVYVKETWASDPNFHAGESLIYRARDTWWADTDLRWKPALYMPEWAARTNIAITDVMAERVQDITPEDCIAEGLSTTLREHDAVVDLRSQFAELWNLKHGPGAWERNDFVWVYSFKRVEG